MRRIKGHDVRWRQATRRTSEADKSTLLQLLEQIEERAPPTVEKRPLEADAFWQAMPSPAKKPKQLQRNPSAASHVSVDSHGFPSMLKDLSTEVDKDARALLDALGSRPVPAKKADTKKEAARQKAEAGPPAACHHPVLGEVKVVCASKKTYVVHKAKGEKKWVHVISVYEKMGGRSAVPHKDLCVRIFDALVQDKKANVKACVDMRESLLASIGER